MQRPIVNIAHTDRLSCQNIRILLLLLSLLLFSDTNHCEGHTRWVADYAAIFLFISSVLNELSVPQSKVLLSLSSFAENCDRRPAGNVRTREISRGCLRQRFKVGFCQGSQAKVAMNSTGNP